MALSRWERHEIVHLIYLEHQGEDEEDWAFEEEPAVEEVATNFLLERIFISQPGFPAAGW